MTLNPNTLVTEHFALAGVLMPASRAAATYTTGWVAAKDAALFLAEVHLGTLGSSATVDAKLQQASDSGGTGAKDITGKAITQMLTAGDKIARINLKPEELDLANSFTHFRLSITVGTAASVVAGYITAWDRRFAAVPANVANVVQTVT